MDPSQNVQLKSFWSKKEGTTGMIVLALLIGAGVYGLSTILPWLITLLQNTIHTVLLAVVLGVIIFLVTDKRVRNLVKYMFKSFMRAITSIFITIDPIGILRNYVSDLEHNIRDMTEQLGLLRGQMRTLQEEMRKNDQVREESLKAAKIAQERGKKSAFVLKARKAGRLQESNLTYKNLYVKMETLYRVLSKMLEAAQFWYEDLSDEVDVKIRERKMILQGYSVFKKAQKVIQGDPDAKELFDQTLEYMAEDYGQKLGEIEHFMDISQGFIESVDIQNGIYEEDALKELENWEKKTESLVLGNQKEQLLLKAADDAETLDLDAPLPQVTKEEVLAKKQEQKTDSKYSRFLE
jgi:hypothetical protein